MAKKNAMQKKVEKAEQMDLLDVAPKNAKQIIAAARLYKQFQAARQTALAEEVKQKEKVVRLVREAKLQPLDGGKIKFEYDRVIVSITPRDELLTVKEKSIEE